MPIETYILTGFSHLLPQFLATCLFYKKQKYEVIAKTFKNLKKSTAVFEDNLFKATTSEGQINLISRVDKNVQMNKLITKSDILRLLKFKTERLSNMPLYHKVFYSEKTDFDYVKMVTPEAEIGMISFNQFGNPNLFNTLFFLHHQNKYWIKNLLYTIDIPKKIFIIKLFIQGKPKHVLIDDSVAASRKEDKENDKEKEKEKEKEKAATSMEEASNVSSYDASSNPGFSPAFIEPSGNNFWILLIEKALAKVSGSYGNIVRMLTSELIPLLTEAPLKIIVHSTVKRRDLWDKIKEATQNNMLCFVEMDIHSLESFSPEHFLSYFAVSIFKVNGRKYIELTTPENGDNTTLNLMTAIKSKLSHINEEDISNKTYFPDNKMTSNKIIFVKFDLFFKTFYRTCILQYDRNYLYNFKKIKMMKNEFNMVKIKLSQKTKMILTLHLKQCRYYFKQKNYEIPLGRMIIARLIVNDMYVKKRGSPGHHHSNGGVGNNLDMGSKHTQSSNSYFEEDNEYLWEYVDSIYGKSEKISIETQLDKGVYYILFKVYTMNDMNVVMSTYSDSFIQFEEQYDEVDERFYQSQNMNTFLTALRSLYTSYLDQFGTVQNVENDTSIVYTHSLSNSNFGYSVLKLDNNTKDKMVYLTLAFENNGMTLVTHRIYGIVKDNVNLLQSAASLRKHPTNNNELSLALSPKSVELVIFEWEKNLNEISIHIRPSFQIEQIQPVFNEKDFLSQPKKFLVDQVYYYEISYRGGVFLVIVNESILDYHLIAMFETLKNLEIENNPGETVEKELKRRSKSCINLKIVNDADDDCSYKISFQLKRVNAKVG